MNVEFEGKLYQFPDDAKPEEIKSILDKSSPAPAQSYKENALQAAMIGAGKTTARVKQGMEQLWYGVTGDKASQEALAKQVADEQALYAKISKEHPFATSVGEALPSLAVPVLGGGTALTAIGGGALAGALPSALSYGSPEERAKGAAVGGIGGAVGAGLGYGLGRLLQPVPNAAQASGEALQAASNIGYKPSPAQVTQNKALGNFENYLARSPGSSKVMAQGIQANQEALNTAAAKSMGEQASNLGETVMGNARTNLGAKFVELQDKTAPELAKSSTFLDALAAVDTANRAKGPFANATISGKGGLVDKGLDLAAQGNLTGQAYKEIHTELASKAKAAFSAGDSSTGQAYKAVREALDKSAKESLGKADQEAWDTVRKNWAAYKVLVKGNTVEAGNVSAPLVASKLRAMGPDFRTGAMTGPLSDVGRIGEAFKSVPNPNSGNLTANMWFSNPVTGLPLAGANWAASHLYQTSPVQSYLTKGLLNLSPMERDALIATGRAGGLLAAPAYLGAQ